MDEQQRVKFGPRPDQDIPVVWAERMLMRLFEKQRKRFGDLLREIVIEDQ